MNGFVIANPSRNRRVRPDAWAVHLEFYQSSTRFVVVRLSRMLNLWGSIKHPSGIVERDAKERDTRSIGPRSGPPFGFSIVHASQVGTRFVKPAPDSELQTGKYTAIGGPLDSCTAAWRPRFTSTRGCQRVHQSKEITGPSAVFVCVATLRAAGLDGCWIQPVFHPPHPHTTCAPRF